jgi:hypothetical protein
MGTSNAGGSDSATESISEDASLLASTVMPNGGLPLGNDPSQRVAIAASSTIPVEIVAGQTATATPDESAVGIVTRVVGLPEPVSAGESGTGLPVVVLGIASIVGEVSQGRGAAADTADPWIVKTSDGVDAKEIATKEGQDSAIAAVDELEVDADATRVATESIDDKTPIGPTTMAGSRPVVFATDHPPVGAELYVGGDQLSNSNPIPIQGTVPPRTPTGTPAATASGQIGTDGAGALLYLRMHIPSPSGTRYILLFDAASATSPATANMIPGVTFPFTPTLGRAEQRFGYPIGFVNGLKWAVSSTEHTYTAAADTAIMFAQWVMA